MFPFVVFAPPLDQSLEMNTGYGRSYFKMLDLMYKCKSLPMDLSS